MNAKNFDINKLRVASPCPANWAEMRGNDQIRFCQLCNLNVYNFSEMTQGQVQSLIAETEGRLCARIYRRTDGTVITQDCPVGLRAYYKRTARLAGAALTAILGLFSVSFGQKDSKKYTDTVPASKVKIVRTVSQDQDSALTGTILDASGAVIPDAEIFLLKKDGQIKITAKSNENGEYHFPSLEAGIYDVEVNRAVGFKNLKIIGLEIKNKEQSQLNITLKPRADALVGVIGIDDLIDTTSSSTTYRIKLPQ